MMTKTILKGTPEVYYETGMEGVGWIVGGDSIESLEFIEDGDYVIIRENDSINISYEGLMFFDPFIVNLCRLGKYRVSFYPVNGFPEGLSPTEWEVFFKKNNFYNIEIYKNILSSDLVKNLLERKRKTWKKEYLLERDLLFSESASMHGVKSDDFFNDEINPRTGFELARNVIQKGMGAINANYLFFIVENENKLDFSKEEIIHSSYPFKEEDFIIPELDRDLMKDYSAIVFDLKIAGSSDESLKQKIKEIRPKLENAFKKAVGQLPVHEKKTYSGGVMKNTHYLRCVKIPPEMSLLFL